MHVHADIFTASHRGCSFLDGLWLAPKTLLQKRGALLYCVLPTNREQEFGSNANCYNRRIADHTAARIRQQCEFLKSGWREQQYGHCSRQASLPALIECVAICG